MHGSVVGPVVVIDDERDLLELLCHVLGEAGFPVLCLDRPQEPERLLVAGSPSVFLIDIMLPGKSGIEVAQELRADGFPQTPMIAMSASTLMIKVAEDTGLFDETISKPFELDQLLGTVARLAG
jgi:two-component system phosphate regulon response regulator PhoB